MVNKNWVYVVSIIIAASLWGVDGILLTPHLYNLNVGVVVMLIHLIPFAIMTPYFAVKHFPDIKKFLRSKDVLAMFLVSLLGGAVGTLSIVKALFLVNFDHLSVVVLLQKMQPVFALTLARLILKERLSRNFFYYALLAIVASYLLTFGMALPTVKTNLPLVMASGLSLLAAFSFGASTVLGRKLVTRHPFLLIHYLRFGITSLIMLTFVTATGAWSSWGQITPGNWGIFFIIAFTTGSGAVMLYYFGLQRVRASIATICELSFPLTAIILDYLINGHLLSPFQWLGAVLLLGAILKIAFLLKR